MTRDSSHFFSFFHRSKQRRSEAFTSICCVRTSASSSSYRHHAKQQKHTVDHMRKLVSVVVHLIFPAHASGPIKRSRIRPESSASCFVAFPERSEFCSPLELLVALVCRHFVPSICIQKSRPGSPVVALHPFLLMMPRHQMNEERKFPYLVTPCTD
jgi:hypothetical protein